MKINITTLIQVCSKIFEIYNKGMRWDRSKLLLFFFLKNEERFLSCHTSIVIPNINKKIMILDFWEIKKIYKQ